MTAQLKLAAKTDPRAANMDKVCDKAVLPYLRSGGRSVAKLTRFMKDALRTAGYTWEEYCKLAGIRI